MSMFEVRYEWLFHPESPGVRILVVRGFWGRLFKPERFATYDEILAYYEFCRGLRSLTGSIR
jgi:hypothetical protein